MHLFKRHKDENDKNENIKQKKNISFEKKSFSSQLNHVKLDFFNKNSKLIIVIKVLFRKKIKFDQSTIIFFRKDKKSTTSINKSENFNAIKNLRFNFIKFEIFNLKKNTLLLVMNIAIIKTSTFNIMNKKKNVNLFLIILKNVEKHLKKHSKLNTIIRNVLSFKYHEFLDVFDTKTFNIFVSHRFHDHKMILKKNTIFEYTFLYKMFEEELKIVKKYFKDNLEKNLSSRIVHYSSR